MPSQTSSESMPNSGALDLSGLIVTHDIWLSAVTDLTCYTITVSGQSLSEMTKEMTSTCFFTAKVDASDVKTVENLLLRGFRLIDTAVTLYWDWSPSSATPLRHNSHIQVDDASKSDLVAVEGIASSSFRFSRFHLDPYFPNTVATKVKGQWARNLVLGTRGDGCLVARIDGQVVGFLGFMTNHYGQLVIDLVAVERAAQGKGVGTAMVRALQESAHKQGRVAAVGTQAANSGSVRLYESLGFRFFSANHVMHAFSVPGETT